MRDLRQTVVPSLVGRAFVKLADARVERWNRALSRLEETQTKELLAIVRRSQDTEIGRARGFASIRSYSDFRQQVPLGDYDSFSASIDRMRRGETNILVPELIRYFGNSSGSSTRGKSKFLPISDTQIKHQTGSGIDGLYRFLARSRDAEFLRGFTLGLFPPTKMREEGPVLITSNPALMAVKKPRVSQLLYLPRHKDCLEESDYTTKLEMVAERYLDYDVRAIAGTTCWFSLLFDKLLMVAKRRGRRATTVAEIWPNLTVLLGGGVSAGPYVDVLKERIGHDRVTLVDTYNATEGGVYAASDNEGEPGMLMIPDRGVFFELVAAEEYEREDAKRVPLWEVEANKTYAIVVTTPSGLYAYKLGDLVRFPKLWPHRIEFVGRTSGCLSTTQELTTHAEVEAAFGAALREHPAVAVDFTCGADVGVEATARSRYVLFAEFSERQAPKDLRGFLEAFDRGLKEANRVYREHRTNDAAILEPELVVLPQGSVDRFLREERRGNVQAKFPRIVDEFQKNILRNYAKASVN